MNIEYAVHPEDAMARRVEELEKENAQLRAKVQELSSILKVFENDFDEALYAAFVSRW